jgi:alanine dehydrogenase
VLILRDDHLRRILSVEDAIDALTEMHLEQAAGAIEMPERVTVDAVGGSFLRVMPAVHNRSGVMGFKYMNVTPQVGARYAIAVIGIADGALQALVDADFLTTLRTSATAAIATKLMAPPEIEELGLLGSSYQAEGLVAAMAAVRTIPRIRVFSPNPERRQQFARRVADETGIEVQAVDSAHDAIRSADLICGAFRAPGKPAIAAADLRPGAHVNSLSSVRPQAREVADDVWQACSLVVVDHRDGVAASGDGLSVARSGAFDLARAPELWEVVRDGGARRDDGKVTMFKSVGAATQDLAVAALAYRLAVERGVGEEIADFPQLRKHFS